MDELTKLPAMPIRAKPYAHQQRTYNFACRLFGLEDGIIKSRGVALLLEMGCGKTLVSIAVSGALSKAGKVKLVLVVAPLSILGVWQEEYAKFADFPHGVTVLTGSGVKKKEKLAKAKAKPLQIVVVNYESAWRLEDELLAYDADLIIADEAHELKEGRTKFSRNGKLFYLTTSIHASAQAGMKPAMCAAFKKAGYGSLVKEDVNFRTLSSFCKEQMAANDGTLPDWLAAVVNAHEAVNVGIRKS